MTAFTEQLKQVFLDTLRETCNVTLAARAAGVSSSAVYAHRDSDALFAERWEEALAEGIDLLEHQAHLRAFNGIDEPVIHKGEPTYLYKRDHNGRVLMEDYEVQDGFDEFGEPRMITLQRPVLDIDPHTGKPKILTIKRYSDTLTTFLLKAHRPDKYRERSQVDQNVTGATQVTVVTGVPSRGAPADVEDLI